MEKATFTLAEAAQLLSCHAATLRRAIKTGVLSAARLGRGFRISRIDLEVFWRERGGGTLFEEEKTDMLPAEDAGLGVNKPIGASGDKIFKKSRVKFFQENI